MKATSAAAQRRFTATENFCVSPFFTQRSPSLFSGASGGPIHGSTQKNGQPNDLPPKYASKASTTLLVEIDKKPTEIPTLELQ